MVSALSLPPATLRIQRLLEEADEYIVARQDTEDEDTEQKIINEGAAPHLADLLTFSSHIDYRVQDVEKKQSLSLRYDSEVKSVLAICYVSNAKTS
jgi:hypothetical protein